MLTTLPVMSLCLAAAAMLFINKTHLVPIVVFIYCGYSPIVAGHEIMSLTIMSTTNSVCCGVLSQLGTYTIHTGIREFPPGTTRSCT